MLYYPLRLISPGPWLMISNLKSAAEAPLPTQWKKGTWGEILGILDNLKDLQFYSLCSLRRKDALRIVNGYRDLDKFIMMTIRDTASMFDDDFSQSP